MWSALKPERELVRSWHQEALSMCQQETALRKQEWHNLSLKREGLRAYDEVQEWT
ncbi:hypothetical protein [Aeromonas enteropelogenes]|uniref:hypothetical protein n=1 Tax=Aeromonas enteropelogenes TaxID=29489 RepID=UPI003B9FDC56